MALLVSYSISPPKDHPNDEAIYLKQGFYEKLFKFTRGSVQSFPLLRQIADLKYKSPILVIPAAQVNKLQKELIQAKGKFDNDLQVPEFVEVCRTAVERNVSLTISGDMYPEMR